MTGNGRTVAQGSPGMLATGRHPSLDYVRAKWAGLGYDIGFAGGAYMAFAITDGEPRLLYAGTPEKLDAEIGADYARRGARP